MSESSVRDFTIVATAALAAFVGFNWYRHRHIVTRVVDARAMRRIVEDAPDIVTTAGGDHSESTAVRNSIMPLVRSITMQMGLAPYVYQQSLSDQIAGYEGSRSMYWARDLCIEPKEFNPGLGCLTLVDVDYHLSFEQMSALAFKQDLMRPIFIATMVPGHAARVTNSYSYRFNVEGNLDYRVVGVEPFVHPVWDWSGDFVCFERHCLFDTKEYRLYHVTRRRLDDDHQLVVLVPAVQFFGQPPPILNEGRGLMMSLGNALIKVWDCVQRGFNYFYESRDIKKRMLARFNPIVANYCVFDVVTPTGVNTTLAKLGDFTSTTVSRAVYDVASTYFQLNKTNLSAGSLASSCPYGTELPKEDAARIVEFLRTTQAKCIKYVNMPGVNTVRLQKRTVDLDAKPSLHEFMLPFISGCVTFDQTKNNERDAIDGRVVKVRSTPRPIPKSVVMKMMTFVELIAPPKPLEPLDQVEISEHRSRSTQRANDAREDLDADNKQGIKSHLKKEGYMKDTNQRVISPLGSAETRAYCRYTHAISRYLREFEWYGPGKSPYELAEQVGRIMRDAREAVMTDAVRMDGSIEAEARFLWLLFTSVCFRPTHDDDLSERLRSNMMQIAVTMSGHKYWTALARNSGSSETTDANSLFEAFLTWAALVEDGYGEREALRMFNVNGDDMVGRDVSTASLQLWADRLNLKIEVERVKRAQLGVNYLNRWFGPGIFFGDLSSCVNVFRALQKFHTCVALPPGMDAREYAANKAGDYALSDSNTPIIGQITSALLNAFGHLRKRHVSEIYFVEQYDISLQWPNNYGEWMQDYVDVWLPNFDYALLSLWQQTCRHNPELALAPPLMDDREFYSSTGYVNFDSHLSTKALVALAEAARPEDSMEDLDARLEMQARADQLAQVLAARQFVATWHSGKFYFDDSYGLIKKPFNLILESDDDDTPLQTISDGEASTG